LRYKMERGRIAGTYKGDGPQCLGVFLGLDGSGLHVEAKVDGRPVDFEQDGELVLITLPAGLELREQQFEITAMEVG